MRTFYAVMAVLLSLSVPARADTAATVSAGAPVRHLVYSFGYGSQNDTSARDSASVGAAIPDKGTGSAIVGSNSGISHYSGSSGDTGTITVDVVREQPDHGLVISVSEQAKNTRNAPPATCVVYGNSFVCDPNKTVNSEEITLLRFLGSNFVDPNQIDAKQHWNVTRTGPQMDVTSDYRIESNDNGVMTIDEARIITEKEVGQPKTDIETKIGYDFNRLLPTTVDEYVTQRSDNGMHGTSTTIYQTSLKLQTDSLAKN